MRFAVINPHMNSDYSGPTVFMNRLFGEVAAESSFEVTAVGPELPNIRSKSIFYARLTTPDLRTVKGQMVWTFKSFRWLLKHHRTYDIVHFHSGYLFNLVAALVPWVLRKPFVVLPLGARADFRTDAKSNRVPFVRSLKRFILKKAHRAFALSNDNASELVAFGVPQTNIIHINNPAAEEFFRPHEIAARHSYNLVLVGKLGVGKRPDLVIEALDQLTKSGWSKATLTLVGPFEDYDFEEQIIDLIDRLGLRRAICVTGYVDNVAEIMAQSPYSVFVLPSSLEGLPGALAESMAMSMPSVVTDVGAMGDVVRASGSGFVIEPSAEAINVAVQRLWSDDDEWAKRARAAYTYARKHFSERAVAKKYILSLGSRGLGEA